MNTDRPLDGIASIRVKLGLLVAASIVATILVAEVAQAGRVPWWISVPVTVAAALAVTQWLARGMTSPLRDMTSAARRMAAGDYGQRVTASSSDEVGVLARAFNAMAADLASADTQRRQLVATVSHELRTPLTAQRALLENLVDGVVRPDDDALRGALRQSERLSALVTDLLDLSRIDAGVAPLALTDVRVADLLRDAVAEAGVAGRPVRVRHEAYPADLTVGADPARLAQLVANLVDNAVRHSPPQGEVLVVARAMGDAAWCLEVRDDGPGIPADRVERVFDRFGSGEDSGGGTGLGLAIARWVCELHGGTISAVPTDPGSSGAVLRAVLPLRPPTDRPTHLTEERAMTSTPIPAAGGSSPAPTASATSTVSAASTARAVTGSAPAAHTPSAPAAAVVATAALAPAPTTQAPAAATVSAGNAPAPGATGTRRAGRARCPRRDCGVAPTRPRRGHLRRRRLARRDLARARCPPAAGARARRPRDRRLGRADLARAQRRPGRCAHDARNRPAHVARRPLPAPPVDGALCRAGRAARDRHHAP